MAEAEADVIESNEMVVLAAYENHVLTNPRGILDHLDGFKFGRTGNRVYHTLQVQKMALKEQLSKFALFDPTPEFATCFNRRITELAWHPRVPFMIGTASKAGDMMFLKGCNTDGQLVFKHRFAFKGRGPGGSIFAIRFDEMNPGRVYTAGLEGNVSRWNIEKQSIDHEFYDTANYRVWFTSMDVSQATKTLFAGDTKGIGYLSTLDGERVCNAKLHASKILHCEFNQSISHLLVTSSLDKTVKLWDLRYLKDGQSLVSLPHEKGANVARFNPCNGSRLLTSDQKNEIRVYQGPLWDQTMSITHPHRQFQHLTPILASWHPLADIIAIGKYPEVPKGTLPPPRPVQFFDADTGSLVHELYATKNEIISLNYFNPTGDILASGQGRSLIFWKSKDIQEELGNKSNSNKQPPGFDRRHHDSDSDSDDSDSAKPKAKKRKTVTKKNTDKKAASSSSSGRGKSRK